MRLLALLLWLAAPAHAERVAVVNLVVEDGSDGERAVVRAAVERGFLKSGAELVERSQLELATACTDDRCRAELGARLAADALVTGRVSKEDDAWVAQLSVFDVALATVTKREQLACVRCSDRALADRIGQLASSLMKAHRAFGRAVLAVRSRPPGAEVWLDQRRVGVTDFELPVAAGPHTVELVRPPGQRVGLAVEVGVGERRVVDLELGPTRSTTIVPRMAVVLPRPVVSEPDGPRRRWRSAVGGVAVSLGAVLAAAGVAFLVENGRGTCELSGGGRQCPELIDSRSAGLGWLVSGGLVAVGGAVMLAVDARRRKVPGP